MNNQFTVTNEIVENCMTAFFAEVAHQFPEIKTGDLPPHHLFGLHNAMKDAIQIWVETNKPEPTIQTVNNEIDFQDLLTKWRSTKETLPFEEAKKRVDNLEKHSDCKIINVHFYSDVFFILEIENINGTEYQIPDPLHTIIKNDLTAAEFSALNWAIMETSIEDLAEQVQRIINTKKDEEKPNYPFSAGVVVATEAQLRYQIKHGYHNNDFPQQTLDLYEDAFNHDTEHKYHYCVIHGYSYVSFTNGKFFSSLGHNDGFFETELECQKAIIENCY